MRYSAEQRETIRQADTIKRDARKADRRERPPRSKPKRETDTGYMAWLHDGLDCIACLIEGRAPAILANGHPNPIEAAHQKHTDLKGPALGKRPPDAASCPLCSWHHRLAPDACDPPQRKFWLRLGINVGAFCRALYDAYQTDQSGQEVIARFVANRAQFIQLDSSIVNRGER